MQISLNRKAGSRVLVAAAIAGLALGASACGGGKKTDTSATETWAGGVCSAFTAWKSSLDDVKSSLTGGGLSGLSSAKLQQAERQVEDATNTLTKSLKKLGPPKTTSGATAKSDVTALQNSLSTSMSAIKVAVPRNPSLSDVVTALPTVTAELTTMATAFSTAVTDLQNADVGAEIEQAFKQAPSCSVYVSS